MLKKIFLFSMLAVLLVMPVVLRAEVSSSAGSKPASSVAPAHNNSVSSKIDNPLKSDVGDTFISLLSAILQKIIMPIAAVVVVCYIIYAGFTYVMAGGNSGKVGEAHQRLLWALVGAGILLGAVGISKAVQNTVEQVINPDARSIE